MKTIEELQQAAIKELLLLLMRHERTTRTGPFIEAVDDLIQERVDEAISDHNTTQHLGGTGEF